MSNLQVLDALTGQLDRHPGNIIVLQDEAGRVLHVQGIDNDLAFGPLMQRVDEAFYDDVEARGGLVPGDRPKASHNVGMARYLDRALAARIMELNGDHIRAAVADLLTRAEIDATVSRFEQIQQYIRHNPDKLLERAEDWNAEVAANTLNQEHAEHHSYWARDVLYRHKKRAINANLISREAVIRAFGEEVPQPAAPQPQPAAPAPDVQPQAPGGEAARPRPRLGRRRAQADFDPAHLANLLDEAQIQEGPANPDAVLALVQNAN
jgi:hypothetical protein